MTFNPNLASGGNFTLYCCFPLNNSETVKAVTLTFCSVQQLFITEIPAKFGILNQPKSLDNGQNSDEGISDFWISGQFFINKNCHSSRNSNVFDMKLRPVTKLDKRNTATSKKFNNDVTSINCDVSFLLQFILRWKNKRHLILALQKLWKNNLYLYIYSWIGSHYH